MIVKKKIIQLLNVFQLSSQIIVFWVEKIVHRVTDHMTKLNAVIGRDLGNLLQVHFLSASLLIYSLCIRKLCRINLLGIFDIVFILFFSLLILKNVKMRYFLVLKL